MEEKIVKDGTKIILFALDTEDTSVAGVITGHWSTMDGKLMYECHYKELDGTEGDLDNLMRKDFEVVPNKFINLTPHTITLNNGTEYHPSGKVARVAVVFPQCSMVTRRGHNLYRVSIGTCCSKRERQNGCSCSCNRSS